MKKRAMKKGIEKVSKPVESIGELAKTRVMLLVVEAVLFAYFIASSRPSLSDAAFFILLLLAFVSYLYSRKIKDVITGVRFSAHAEILPVYAAMLLYGLSGAVIINFAAYVLSLLVRKRLKSEASEHTESALPFLLVAYPVSRSAALLPESALFQNMAGIASIIAGIVIVAAFESYFESAKSSMRFRSQFEQSFWIAYPQRISLFLLLVILGISNIDGAFRSLVLTGFCYLMYLVFTLIFANALENHRNRYAVVFELLSSLRTKNESEERQRLLMIDYVRRMAHEANLKGKDFDKTEIAAMLHDFGKAGIDIYSFDSIIEDLRANKGDPLHAERAAVSLSGTEELKDIAEVLRYHHRYHDRESMTRSKKHLKLQASLLNVAESFSELLVTNEDPVYDERSAYKDLKKGSGWDFDPKALRLLKKVLMRKGIKRL